MVFVVSTSRSVGCGFFFFGLIDRMRKGQEKQQRRESRMVNVLDAV